MKKYILIVLILALIGSCCTKEDNCKCPPLTMSFTFDCFTEKELANFEIIKYDSTSGKQISTEKMIINHDDRFGNSYEINLETDTKYKIAFLNRPLGISRLFYNFRYSVDDSPLRCYDCKSKTRFKTCNKVAYVSCLVNGIPIDKKSTRRIDDSTYFQGVNIKNCPPFYRQ